MNARSAGRVRVLRITILTTLAALVAEFVLGIITNLYVQFPSTPANSNVWHWSMTHSPVVISHVVVGIALVLLSLATIVLSIIARRLSSVVYSCIGFVLILIAWMAGITFLTHGQQNSSSLDMAIGFIGAFVVYYVSYYTSKTA